MKAKTHSGLKKRIRRTGTGKLMSARVAKRHLLQNKSAKAKGKDRYGRLLNPSDFKKVKSRLNNK